MKIIPALFVLIPLFACAKKHPEQLCNTITTTVDTIAPKQELTLLFAGDFMQHQAQIDAAKTSSGYDYTPCFEHVKEQISSADIAIGNLEVALGGKPYTGYPAFSAPDEFLHALTDAGFDIMLTANNHCLDRRKKGLERTIYLLDSLNIPYAGTYRDSIDRGNKYPLLINKNGFRIALLNYTYGTNGIAMQAPNIVNYIDRKVILKDIEKAKAMKPDAIIACMHWGEEYVLLPNKSQKELANWLIDQGVDHVIGGHPHVVQPAELRTDSITQKQNIVVYSLGNFISNMSAKNTDGGMMFTLTLEKDSTTRIKECGYNLVWTERPAISGKKNFILYPTDYPSDSLNTNSRNRLNIYKKATEMHLEKHNREIGKSIFIEKK